MMRRPDGGIEYRHYMDEIFNGLIANHMSVEQVIDPHPKPPAESSAAAGSWEHEEQYVQGGFAVLARKI
jgi:hypothetical protein